LRLQKKKFGELGAETEAQIKSLSLSICRIEVWRMAYEIWLEIARIRG
jgi:hypothetical protein